MPLEQWQIALRRPFGRDEKFKMMTVDGGADPQGEQWDGQERPSP